MRILTISFLFLLGISLNISNAFAGTINGKVSASGAKTLKNILIYVEKVEGKEFSPPKESVKVDQAKLVFTPRVSPVIKGTTVEFYNSDNVKHNVFGVGADDFDLGTWTQGIVKSHTFNKLGEVAILCNVHPEMEAYVIVLQNPYFTLAKEDGSYQIKDIPAGNYKLKTWRENSKSVTKGAEVPAEGNVTVDFELK